MTSKTYKKSECCDGQDCSYLNMYPDQPCWGQVDPMSNGEAEGGEMFIHICEGHAEFYDGGTFKYIPEETDET
jgi:hypothetical protein